MSSIYFIYLYYWYSHQSGLYLKLRAQTKHFFQLFPYLDVNFEFENIKFERLVIINLIELYLFFVIEFYPDFCVRYMFTDL